MVTMTQKPLKHGLKVALYQPDIPQNTASIIRTCSCLGASLEIIEPCGFLFSDKRFKRVVMDYLDYSEIKFYKSPKEFFDENIKNPHEANYLKLDISKAMALLNWVPKLSIEESLTRTVEWYINWKSNKDVHDLCLQEIDKFLKGDTNNG